MNLIELTQKAIEVDSSVRHGTKDIAQFFLDQALKLGMHAEILSEIHQGVPQGVVLISNSNKFSSASRASFSPIETLDPGDYSRWTKTGGNPFLASIDGDTMYGLGTSQGKGSFSAQLVALAESKAKDMVLVGTYGPETGAAALKLIRKKTIQPKVALVSFPTEMQVSAQGAGFAKIQAMIPYTGAEKAAKIQGELSEASTSQSKMFSAPSTAAGDYVENPIVKMIDYIKNLPEGVLIVSAEGGNAETSMPDSVWLELDVGTSVENSITAKLVKLNEVLLEAARQFRKIKAMGFEPEHSTFNVGRIRTYEDGLLMSGACRLVPAENQNIYEEWLARLKTQAGEFGAIVDLLEFRAPFVLPKDSVWLNKVLNFGQIELSAGAAECTTANLLSRFGVESIVLGPGSALKKASSSNESISMSALEKSVAIYKNIFSGAYL